MEAEDIRILIVDDEKGICETLETHFSLDGYEVETAQSGAQGLEKMREKPFHIIFTDINMPNMDGIEFLEEVKKIRADTYVVMITAYTTLTKVLSSRYHGAFDYVLKPFRNLDEVDDALKRVVSLLERWQGVMQETRAQKES